MLLESSALAAPWAELLTAASRIDIAIAWITSKERTDDLVAFALAPGNQVRVIVGVKDNLTSVGCLRALHNAVAVKIGHRHPDFTFHPKVYLFTLPDRLVCWVGSANLTSSGFGGNSELMHEYDDDGSAAAWFEYTWDCFEYPNADWLDRCEQIERSTALKRGGVEQIPPPTTARPLDSWPAYYSALRRADQEWLQAYEGKCGIFSGLNSYVKTIRTAQPLIRSDWDALSRKDADVLLGLIDDDGSDWGLLGSMTAAATAKDVFLKLTPEHLRTRREIRDAIELLCKVPLNDSLPLLARKTHEVITNRKGFDVAVATRLMALARPEVFVSVNSKSVNKLAHLSALTSGTIKTSAGYEKLVKWIMGGKWWNSPEPKQALEREAWSYRAALIDGLIYQGHGAVVNM